MMLRGAGSEVDGVWSHSSDTGQLAWAPDSDAASSAGGDPKDGQKCLGLSPGHVADDRVGAGNGSFFESVLYTKTIILPRQARDKRRESTQNKRRFNFSRDIQGATQS